MGEGAAFLVASALLAAACRAPDGAVPAAGPYAVVLGTAQDGGRPQIACRAECCESARRDPTRRRLASALLVVDPRDGRRWLFDAGPDLSEQVERARAHAEPTGAGRPPLFDGVFLTHAHVGHYLGLAHLGREAYAAEGQRVYATEGTCAFLERNGPWELLAREGHVVLERLRPGEPVQLAPDLTVTAVPVPHRHEYSDTVAFVVRGPRRALLYLPDIDKWERWDVRVEDLLAEVDVALLDGSFFSDGEVGGRDMSTIPHPFMVESLERFGALPAAERAKVRFTHLNHSNPAADPESAAARRVREAGMAVAAEGERHEL